MTGGRKQKGDVPTGAEWEKEATAILTSLMARESCDYRMLALRLSERGAPFTEKAVRQKVERGSYQFVFLMQVLVALGRDLSDCSIELTLPPASPEMLMQSRRNLKPIVEKRSKTRKAAYSRMKATNRGG